MRIRSSAFREKKKECSTYIQLELAGLSRRTRATKSDAIRSDGIFFLLLIIIRKRDDTQKSFFKNVCPEGTITALRVVNIRRETSFKKKKQLAHH